MDMDEFDRLLLALGDAVSAAAEVPIVFAECLVPGLLRTRPQTLLEFIHVERGRLPLTVGDRHAVIERDQMAMVNAHFGNFGVVGAAVRYSCVSFDIREMPELLEAARAPLLIVRRISAATLAQRYRAVADAFHSPPGPMQAWRLKADALSFLYVLATASGATAGGASPSPMASRVDQVLRSLTLGQGRPGLAIAALAREHGMSHAHLCRLFRRRLGIAPSRYLLELRMRRAAGLLARTRAQVKDICRQVGYRDPLYFSRVFKAYAGLSPLAYRRKGHARTRPG